MSSLHNQVKKLKYDRRLFSMSIKNGEMTKEEMEKHLKTLEDCADRAKSIKIHSGGESTESVN
jgi:exopolyphosphatase/pppGpp-phosphohydrolase